MKTLKEIESLYDFSEVTYRGVSVWMLLRSLIHLKIVERNSDSYSMSFRTKSVIKLIKNGKTGISNLFRLKRFDYWFFANTDKRNLINGKYKENYFDDIADKLGQEKSLFVEYTVDAFEDRNLIYSKYVVSDLVFKLLAYFVSKFIILKKDNHLESLKKMIKEENLNLNFDDKLKKYIAEYMLYKKIFKYTKPKAIFVICYYSKIPILIAAHDCKIKVIEYQHGVITKESGEYNSCLKTNKRYFPDLLLSFGENLLMNNYSNFIYLKENILPLGSSYMESIRLNFKDDYLDQLKTKYSKIVCVTSSGIFLSKLMMFVRNLSLKNPDILFVVRKKHRENIDQYLSGNIILLPQYNIYHILKYSDYNITIGSFVAYEADYFGVSNILLNINNISRDNITTEINGIYVEENDLIQFDFPNEKLLFTPSKNYFVRFNDKIDTVCSLLQSRF